MTLDARLLPSPLETACGTVFGPDPDAEPLPRTAADPRPALDRAIRTALTRAPCLVAFSGGRDSSAVLAAATHLARREGLPLPVPATYRFPAAPKSQEDEWQEQVVRHLGLTDWERLSIDDELDLVGPVAEVVLRGHGLVWPFNAHFFVPLLQRATGGTLLTGTGGDEVLGATEWDAARAVLTGRSRRPAAVRRAALALAPRPVRRAWMARRPPIRWPWLQPAVDAALQARMAASRAQVPLRWDGAKRRWWQTRYRTVLAGTSAALAADHGAQIVHPFLTESVAAAVVSRFGARGPGGRDAAFRALVGDVLPEAVLTRTTKASFDEAFFAGPSRAFVATWDGQGTDPALVDTGRLAEEWRSPRPAPLTYSLLQCAWLARQRTSLCPRDDP